MSTDYAVDSLTALPLVDTTANVTYANPYCALCTNKTRDLHLWSFWISNMDIPDPGLHDINATGTIWKAMPVGGRMHEFWGVFLG